MSDESASMADLAKSLRTITERMMQERDAAERDKAGLRGRLDMALRRAAAAERRADAARSKLKVQAIIMKQQAVCIAAADADGGAA